MTKATCISIDLINADKPPASLAFLAGACETADIDYQCISLNNNFLHSLTLEDQNNVYNSLIKLGNANEVIGLLKPVLSSLVNEINSFAPDVVLVSVFSFMQQTLTIEFLKSLRTKMPTVEIIIGGPGVTYPGPDKQTFGANLLAQNLIDYYCLGEGDIVLKDFLKGNKNQLGLNSRHHKIETWVPQIDALDEHFQLPSYKKISVNQYHNLEAKDAPVYSISTSRGCVRKCTFCDVANTFKKYRYRSGHLIANEILKHHQDVGAVHFSIVDSLINGSLKNFKDFNNAMIKLKQKHPGLEKFSYNGMFIVRDRRLHDEDFFRLIKAAGCESLAIGVETGSERLRFEMDKKFTNDALDYHFEMSAKYGIGNVMLTFVGYPTETRQDFEDSLAMLEKYQKYLINNTIIGVNHSGVFSMIDNTPVFTKSHDLGIDINYRSNGQPSSRGIIWVNKNNPELTLKERALRDLEFRRKALELRYPVPYANRYIQYLKDIDKDFLLISD